MSLMHTSLADLARIQRYWADLTPSSPAGDGRLAEVQAFGSNPGALRMLCFVPPGLPAGAPLVVVLHGCAQTAAAYDAGAGWSDMAARHNFALLFPEQRSSNNAHACFNWFEPGDVARGSGEVASIRQMVAHMLATHALDPRRVFVTGLSAGGTMTAALLATYPDVFAGGAVIAGLPYGVASGAGEAMGVMNRSRGLPAATLGNLVRAAGPVGALAARPRVAIWHGETDQTVAPGNALDSAKQWTDVHGLREADGVEDTVDGVPHRVWRDRGGAVQVELFSVPQLGHGTPIRPRAEGEQGVGQTAPYMLDSPIASTWHIARSWGLLGQLAEAGGSAPPVPPAPKQPALATDAEGVATRALRPLGLAKGG